MISNEIDDGYKILILDVIKKHLPECRVYLYGERARAQDAASARVGLALDMGKPIDFATLHTIKKEIQHSTIPIRVDLIDMCNASDEIKREIEVSGKLLTE